MMNKSLHGGEGGWGRETTHYDRERIIFAFFCGGGGEEWREYKILHKQVHIFKQENVTTQILKRSGCV